MGSIWVDVQFGNKQNWRTENLLFEVVDLESPYHALLGRPALAKFMASDHVAYLKLKMPKPNGVITIAGNHKRSMESALAGSNLAQSLVIAEEKKRIKEVVERAQQVVMMNMPNMANPNGSVTFQPLKESKEVSLDPAFPDCKAIIGSNLDLK